jgi:hypothetical protein
LEAVPGVDKGAIHHHDRSHQLAVLEISKELDMPCGPLAHGCIVQEYNYKILYIPGKENTPPNALSRQPGVDQGKDDNQDIIVLPSERFRMATTMTTDKILVPPLNEVKRGIMNLMHDDLTAGHPG